jgi:hypothetical protein
MSEVSEGAEMQIQRRMVEKREARMRRMVEIRGREGTRKDKE